MALLAVSGIATTGLLVNHRLNAPVATWLSLLYPTLFAGLLAQLLSDALDVKRLAMQQAQLHDRRFDALARSTRHIFMIFDAAYRLKYVNHALEDVIGYTEKEVASNSFHVEVHPDDLVEHEKKLRHLFVGVQFLS